MHFFPANSSFAESGKRWAFHDKSMQVAKISIIICWSFFSANLQTSTVNVTNISKQERCIEELNNFNQYDYIKQLLKYFNVAIL